MWCVISCLKYLLNWKCTCEFENTSLKTSLLHSNTCVATVHFNCSIFFRWNKMESEHYDMDKTDSELQPMGDSPQTVRCRGKVEKVWIYLHFTYLFLTYYVQQEIKNLLLHRVLNDIYPISISLFLNFTRKALLVI